MAWIHLNTGRIRVWAPPAIGAWSRAGAMSFASRGAWGAKVKLLPESGDLFFRARIEGRILFHRDAGGKVNALYDRRNNEDVVWKKAP